MLVTSTKTSKSKTDWDNLGVLEKSVKFHKKIPKKSNESETKIFDEYGKLSNTITMEYIHQLELLSKLQQSYLDIFTNSVSISYNFFNLSFDLNNRLTRNLNSKKNKKSD